MTEGKLRRAINFLDELSEEISRTQRRLEDRIIRLVRDNGYDKDYWGSRLDLAYLSSEGLLDLKEEMRHVTAAVGVS